MDKRRIAFLHAHPDDETIATGALIASFVAQGIAVAVVTATRGERGEARPGALAAGETLLELRERELGRALQALGVETHCFLGEPPALASSPQRRYLDSGMRWITPTLAGPVADAGPDSLSQADPAQAAADLAAFCRDWAADALMSYDATGGYGHPDHVACHELSIIAAETLGIDRYQIVAGAKPGPGGEWVDFDLTGHQATAKAALACYSSQLRVDGDEIVHVGGQREPITVRMRLELNRPATCRNSY
ncbi:MAG: PIG-L family deacetylase [Propionibacteriaceae bacterium]|jgi:N-acetyl-1-D-myo-inositol-2-amino-2-deoxy-alpha-D-glucopyranoside deacetylase|nr:PIG-L family deacetylase [Propionibacteriaceae bacterium]